VKGSYGSGAYYRVNWDAFNKQTPCSGDSGGSTGAYHAPWYTADAVTTGALCGEYSYVTSVRFNSKFITDTGVAQ
jgi:hypothetical protein